MKVSLVNLPQTLRKEWKRPEVFQPIGLAYIASFLEQDHVTRIIDANATGELKMVGDEYFSGSTLEELEDAVRRSNPDVVGISVPFSMSLRNALEISRSLKRTLEILVVLGGAGASVQPEEALKTGFVDYVVIGEGERTMQRLLEDPWDKKRMKEIDGLAYRDGRSIIVNQKRSYIKDLDSLPFPARHLLPMESYFAAYDNGRVQRSSGQISDRRWTPMITSRGCPYQCVFCSIHLTHGRMFRSRSPENVIAEIESVQVDFRIRHIIFEDDNLTLRQERFARICDLIVEKGIDITWTVPNGVRADTITESLARKMARSGCQRVMIAPESGNQSVLDNIVKKRLNLKDVERAMLNLRNAGIDVDVNFVIGLVGETKKQIWDTIKFGVKLARMGGNCWFNIATPLYGTELYKQARDGGYLTKDFDSVNLNTFTGVIQTEEWTPRDIKMFQDVGYWLTNLSLGQKLRVLARFGTRFDVKSTYERLKGLAIVVEVGAR